MYRTAWTRIERASMGALFLLCGGCSKDDREPDGEGENEELAGDGGAARDAGALDARVLMDAAGLGGPRPGSGSMTARDSGSSNVDGAAQGVEVCDGRDNDGNGQADDVDLQKDGLCDCLAIATLGKPGGSGQGNVFGAWLNARSDLGAVALGEMTLTADLLRPFQVIVAQDLRGRAYTPSEAAALEEWVRAGGGLLTLTGFADPSENANVNQLLKGFQISYEAAPILPKRGSTSIPITTWLGPHPVVEGITQVGIDNGYAVSGMGVTLAQEGGHDLLLAKEVGSGHLLVYGDEWITYDSEWSGRPEYQVERLWLNMIKWLTAARTCQVPTVYL